MADFVLIPFRRPKTTKAGMLACLIESRLVECEGQLAERPSVVFGHGHAEEDVNLLPDKRVHLFGS